MPTRPAVAGVIKHQLMYRWRNQWCVSTFRVDHGATPTQAMVDADRAVLHQWCLDDWRGFAEPGCRVYGVKSWSLETTIPAKFPDAKWYPTMHVDGTMAENVVAGLTFAVSLRTGAAGTVEKPPHGRLYHVGGPPISVIESNLSRVTLSYANSLGNRYVNLLGMFTGVGNIGTWCVVSYWLGGTRAAPVLRGTPAVLPVDHVRWDQRLDIQRRRMPRQQAFSVN